MFSAQSKKTNKPVDLTDVPDQVEVADVEVSEVEQLKQRVAELEETVRRSQADYHNMMRRHQEQSQRQARMAGADVIRVLIQPLSHLELAAKQLNDKGLDMVVQQFWHQLNTEGVEKTGEVGSEFDPLTMEAISQQGEGTQVVAVSQPGYIVHGEVIQPAKVVVGSMTTSEKKE